MSRVSKTPRAKKRIARPGIRGVWLLIPVSLGALAAAAALGPVEPAPAKPTSALITPAVASEPDVERTTTPEIVPTYAIFATNVPVADLTMPLSPTGAVAAALSPTELLQENAATNSYPVAKMSDREFQDYVKRRLESARYLRNIHRPLEAEPILIELLGGDSPDAIKRSALLELAATAQDQHELARALQVYAQFLNRWSDDLRGPEVLFRQGQLFRQMGINNMALSKFYAVMTSALVLKNDRLDYYEQLVLKAQTEIAETHFQLGKYADAAEFYSRLLKQSDASLDRARILYRLVRATSATEHYNDTIGFAQDFLTRFPESTEQPEVRFHLAVALKNLHLNNESLQQVLTLLKEQRERTKDRPAVWSYWQQRTGNLIANQLYREGDYARALGIYLDLAQLDNSSEWQLPVKYQIGITYEQLLQPEKATDIYRDILNRETESGTNVAPGIKAIFDMARYRTNFIGWQSRADAVNHNLRTARETTF